MGDRLRGLPARLVDAIDAPVLRLAVGRIEDLGLRRAAGGPRLAVEKTGRVPVFDIGTLARIRDGRITVRAGIDRLTRHGAVFRDGAQAGFDALVLATGFRSDLRPLLPTVEGVLDAAGQPLATGRTTRAPGLYLCGHLNVAHLSVAGDPLRGRTHRDARATPRVGVASVTAGARGAERPIVSAEP